MSNVDWGRFEHVLESLGVLARLTENKKLTLREGNLDIDNDKKLQFLLRWWNSDDHDGCLDNIKQTVQEAIHMARSCLDEILHTTSAPMQRASSSYHKSALSGHNAIVVERQRSLRRFGRLTEALEGATHGIETQKVTYKNDDQFCARVDVLIGNMRDELHDMDIMLKLVAETPATTTRVPPSTPAPSPSATTLVAAATASYTTVAEPPAKTPFGNSSSSDEDEEINLF